MNQSFVTELDALLPGVRRLAPSAFHSLYLLLSDRLNTFAFSYLRDRGSAEDAVQQAFLELVQGASGIKGDGRSLQAWLFRSVRFGCLDEIRRRARKPVTFHAEVPDTSTTVDEPDIGLDPNVERALASLTPQQRAIMYLRHVIGMSGAEVAEVLGSNRAAVFAAAARAERRLRSLLGGER